MFESEHLASTAKTCDDLVRDQQNLVLIADLPDTGEVIILRNDYPASALYGLR